MSLQVTNTPPLPGATLVAQANTALANLAGQNPSIAAAATTDLGSNDSITLTITGNTTITSFGSNANLISGQVKVLLFTGTPIITFNAGSMITPTGADLQMRAGDSLEMLYLGSGNWRVLSYANTGARQILTGNRTYFVRTDGSDSNNGLANTSAGAFLTLQKAYNVIAGQLDLAGFSITIQVGDGTYTAGIAFTQPWTGGGTLTVTGNTGTPTNCFINAAGQCFQITCSLPGVLTLQGFKLASAGGNAIQHLGSGTINYGAVNFGVCGGNHIICAGVGGFVNVISSYTISGGALAHWKTFFPNVIQDIAATTVTLSTASGTPLFSQAFAAADSAGIIYFGSGTPTFVGSTLSTGTRYIASANGLINSNGAGATYLPGAAAGSTTTQGQYL